MFASATEPEAVADSDIEIRHTGPRLIANKIRGIYWTMMHRHELGRAGITVQFTDGVSHKGRGGFVADALTACVAEGFSSADRRVLGHIPTKLSARPE